MKTEWLCVEEIIPLLVRFNCGQKLSLIYKVCNNLFFLNIFLLIVKVFYKHLLCHFVVIERTIHFLIGLNFREQLYCDF